MFNNVQKIEIRVPGSTANLGPGFDSFGLALPIYLRITLQLAKENSIKLKGNHLSSLPNDENNLVYKTIKYLFDLEKREVPKIQLEIESDIPLSRGLGSSGAAIIGGLLAANQLLDKPKSLDEIFQIATEIEGHPDNVGASLFGGFVVTAYDGINAKLGKLPFPHELKILLAIPNYTLSTTKARRQIPEDIPIKDVIFNIGHASLLLTYLVTGQLDKINSAMKDKVHQPYREEGVRGLKRILEQSDKMGIFGAALSGAGPSIIFLVQEHQMTKATDFISNIATEENITLNLKTLSVANEGATLSLK